MEDPLLPALRQGLARLHLRAWRLHLETPEVEVCVPLLRGVWGKALHDLDVDFYRRLFEGGPAETPGYLMRPAPPEAFPAPALDFLLFGPPDPAAEALAWAAWDLALQRGLGSARRPARLVEVRPLAWDGTALRPARRHPGFALFPLSWPSDASPGCRLAFPAPLRVLRDGRLLEEPTLADLTLATLRRLQALAPEPTALAWEQRRGWLELARSVPAACFHGAPLDLVRYSGRQREEVELHGVSGALDLPMGPGPLADLMLAASWLHLGKGTVFGLGQMLIQSLPTGG